MKRLITVLALLAAAGMLTGCKSNVTKNKDADGKNIFTSAAQGIDVSHHQGNIDWEKVAQNKDINFVYIKATEGATYVDPMFKKNLAGAKENGLKAGAYHFLSTTSSAKRQFDNFRRHCCMEKADLIPVLDFERTGSMGMEQLRDMIREFSSLCEKEFGSRPIIYTSTDLYNNIIYPDEGLREHIMFIGHPYLTEPNLKGNRKSYIWQYSARGKMPGIDGSVDLDRLVGLSLSDILLTE